MSTQNQILIVEDSEETTVFLSEILEDHGYQHRLATDGKEAMAAMQESQPDLVLLDIMMPQKSGVVVFKEMQRDPELEKIPVIFVTGVSQDIGVDIRTGEEKPKKSYMDDFAHGMGAVFYEKFKNLEADGFIEKPIDPSLLIEKIKELLP